jgi:hypothetical protein
MTGPRHHRPRPRRGLAAAAAVALAWTCLATSAVAATADGDARRGPTPAAPSIPTPMATSIDAADGTWATVPMGRLDESLNTFWQLFYRPTPTAPWSNQVEATATATNGGLVLASGTGSPLVVGVRPSSYLTYTPVIATSAPGATPSWSDGLITAGLAARPGALAVGAGGRALALVGGHAGATVLGSSGNLSAWATLTTAPAIGSAGAGRACGLGTLTAVGYLGSRALVGASCGRPGVVGLFARRGGAWRLAGPALPRALSAGRVEVLSVQAAPSGTSVLLAVSRGARTDLVAAWSAEGGQWATSAPLPVPAGAAIASYGPTGAGGFFVLSQPASGRDTLAVAQPSTATWRTLPPPPPGTATVAFGPSSPTEALVGSTTVLTVWSLDPATGHWVAGQGIHVPIQYGSSTQ